MTQIISRAATKPSTQYLLWPLLQQLLVDEPVFSHVENDQITIWKEPGSLNHQPEERSTLIIFILYVMKTRNELKLG